MGTYTHFDYQCECGGCATEGRTEICKECSSVLYYASGIGWYCSNKECHHVDWISIDKIIRESKETLHIQKEEGNNGR